MEPVTGLFTSEWLRFTQGLEDLTTLEREERVRLYRRSQASPDGSNLIALPGWSEIVHTSVPYQPSREEAREYYRAKRAGRVPDLPPFVAQELRRREQVKERIARSPEPAYAQAFGSILTAVDNVQDFMSTVATAGRLGLWAGPRIMGAIVPGVAAGTAEALATVASRRAAAAAAAEFGEVVAARAAAGNLVARLALADSALFAAAKREAVESAAALAYRLAFSRATLGVAGRLAARFIPVLGWVILASDLLNVLSLLGMAATPLYALLCRPPQEALAAGVPAALFKQALKRETWRAHNLNPFSRQAVAARALRSAGRLPSVSNLVEVAQTTDALFGIGISLGGLVGLLNSLTFGLVDWSGGQRSEFRGAPDVARRAPELARTGPQADPHLAALARGEIPKEFEPRRVWDPLTRRMIQQAAVVATTAPAIQAVQEVFTEDEHLLTALAHWQALALLRAVSIPEALADAVPAAAEATWPAPLAVAPDTVMWAEATGRRLEEGRRWWFGRGAAADTGVQYVEHHATAVPAALRAFLGPRRNAPVAALYGAIIDETWQAAFLLAENDPDLFHMSLTPDARLISSLAEEGYILAPEQDQTRVWRWWQAARAELARTEATSLRPGRWSALAEQHGVQLVRLLPSEASVPAAWQDRLPVLPPQP